VVLPPEGEGDPILFDCADPYVAARFFDNHAITHLAAVVVSHLDVDHIRGILPFLKQHFAKGGLVDRLVLGLDRREVGDAATALLDAALAWEANPPHAGFQLVPPHRSSGPVRLLAASNWSIDLVLPFYGTSLEAQHNGDASNLASAVLRVERGTASVLVGGDAPLGSWERLEPNLRGANVIRVPHHGGEIREGGHMWTTFDDLYNAVKADRAVVSVGSLNRHAHPRPDHLAAMRRGTQCRVLCTQMTEQCHAKLPKVRADALQNAAGLEYPYRHRAKPGHPSQRPPDEVPCAGTVLISIDASGTVYVLPKPARHEALISQLDRPLCVG
jgi:hypothetical protein